jgi:hypothetical protein
MRALVVSPQLGDTKLSPNSKPLNSSAMFMRPGWPPLPWLFDPGNAAFAFAAAYLTPLTAGEAPGDRTKDESGSEEGESAMVKRSNCSENENCVAQMGVLCGQSREFSVSQWMAVESSKSSF